MLSRGRSTSPQAELDPVTVPTSTPEMMQLAGMLALYRAQVAAADSRPGDVDPVLEMPMSWPRARGRATLTGWGSVRTNIGCCRAGRRRWSSEDYDRAVSVAEGVNPELLANRSRQAAYWVDYGRGLTRLRGRQDDAVRALHQAELILPHPRAAGSVRP